MKKTFLFLAALLTATVMNLHAATLSNVKYIDANGKEQTCSSATVVENASESVNWYGGWYVVTGSNVILSQGAFCYGDVHIILADGAKLTASGGNGFSGILAGAYTPLYIYGQAGQTGQLIATGSQSCAGIGGIGDASGGNVTINGGKVTATGGNGAAGIGGGEYNTGSNITINGGEVTAIGGNGASGIGNGYSSFMGDASNIFVNPSLLLKADGNNPPTSVIAATRTASTDVASSLAGRRCVTAKLAPDMHDMLYFTSLKDNGTVKLNKVANAKFLSNLTATFEYSKNRINWTEYTWGTYGTPVAETALGAAIALAKGDTVFFRAKGTNGKNATLSFSSWAYFQFAFGADDSIAAGGNSMSLYDASCEQNSMTNYGFYKLFIDAKQLVSAPKLPATQIGEYCYNAMFSGNSSLRIVQETLPATQLADYCYGDMFKNCTSLTAAPALPAKDMKSGCYNNMFNGCSALTTVPELKATTLAMICYYSMFYNCTALQVDPISGDCNGSELEVPSPASEPYIWNSNMFYGCNGTAANNIQLGGHYCIKKYVPTLSETITKADLTALVGQTLDVKVGRTMQVNGTRHTICLPFSLSESEFAASPFAGCTSLQKFSSATIENSGAENETLVLEMTEVSPKAIEAGKPYIITWPNDGSQIEYPQFDQVTIETDVAESEEPNPVSFCGTFVPYQVESGDKGILFINADGKLNWPNANGNINGFRCYFALNLSQDSPLRRGMAAMLGEGRTTPTSVEDAACNMYDVRKLIEEGRVVIISNGVRYDMNGNLVK